MMNVNLNRSKKIAYNYDLVSGKVNKVIYQPGMSDQWLHRYSYDAENRLTLVETSTDNLVWEKDARYEYYRHGPLPRVTVGDQQSLSRPKVWMQGMDYAYTLQGWLKGINSTGGTAQHDMGADGLGGSVHQYTARDAMGLTLNYFAGDYGSIGNTNPFPGYSGYLPPAAYRPLYNGNISSSGVYQRKFEGGNPLIFYNYRYDQLNRLTGQDAYNGFRTGDNDWANMDLMDSTLMERVTYDANGNILKYLRNSMNSGIKAMDNLTYVYYPNTNRLSSVKDAVHPSTFTHPTIVDIDDQANNNYIYDSIGNLAYDASNGSSRIYWNVYGKIIRIEKSATTESPATMILYEYDPLGNRIGQAVNASGTWSYTWYVRDAQGNIISTYTAQGGTNLGALNVQQENRYIYGSSRLGAFNLKKSVDGGPVAIIANRVDTFTRGNREYELTNHLGNVLATVSDKKFGVISDTNSSLIDHYEADIVNATDYYPFGMPSRVSLTGKGYTHGFNGKLNDNDVKGGGNQIDYGARVYDPRIGRFLSVDPLQKQFPWLTPYQFSANSPILFVDLDGLEPMKHFSNWSHSYEWAKKDYHDDGYSDYSKLDERDSKGRPYLVRSRKIGLYPYTSTQFQYYDYDKQDYDYFVPTGYEPDYIQNLKDLERLGEFGKTMEAGVVAGSTMWNPVLRQLMMQVDIRGSIDNHHTTTTRERVTEIHKQVNLPDRLKNSVFTVAIADVEDKDGNKYRLVAVNSASQQNSKIMSAFSETLKPREFLVPNMLGGDAHAEENLNEFAKRYGLTVKSIDVNRPFCKTCSEERRKSSASTSTSTSKRDPKPRKPATSKTRK